MMLWIALVCVTLFFGSVLCTVAGPSSAGSGTQIAPVTDSVQTPVKTTTDIGVGTNARDSAGSTGSQTGGSSTSDSASASSAASSNGSGSSGYGISSHATNDSNNVSKEIAREKVIDTGDKAVETDKAAKAEPSDKTFAPHLLDTVSDIPAVGAQKEHGSGSKTDESKSAASEDKNDSHK